MSKTVIYQTIDIERLQRVKKFRQIQIQRWIFNEKEIQKIQINDSNHKNNSKRKHIEFGKDVILLEAISRNDIKEVRELLSQGVNPDATTIDGLTGLHQCCIDDFREMAELLIKYKANVNAFDSERWTPLHAAATCSNAQMCMLLSKHGADFLALNSDGNMPYEICDGDCALKIMENEMGKKGITQQQIDDARLVPEHTMLRDVKKLFQNKADLDELDSQGAAMIHIACSLGYSEVVQTLLEAGANYLLPDKDGWLPIHLAACWSHVDIVEYLVVFGTDINMTNENGDTIFDLCDTEIRDKLLYIKDNLADIRKNYNFSRLPPYKGFRRSRGSSVRRTSVRQKNMLSKKEAKEEFIALTQTVPSPPEMHNPVAPNTNNHIPITIEENSDIDSSDINVQLSKKTVSSLKQEDKSSSLANRDTRSKIPAPVISSQPPANTIVQKSESDTKLKMKDVNNHQADDKVTECSLESPNHLKGVQSPTSEVDPSKAPRFVFISPTESTDDSSESKTRHRKECCHIL